MTALRHSSVDINPGLAMPKHGREETDEEFDARYERYFNRPDIDGWEIRKALADLQGMDLVPEPKIIIAAMKACRRVNDYALCVRILEAGQVQVVDVESKKSIHTFYKRSDQRWMN